MFRACLRPQSEPSTAVIAVRGLDLLAGPEEARAAWLALLNDPRPQVVARAALYVRDVVYAPLLLDMLGRVEDPSIRSAVINVLGRLKYAPAYRAILDALDRPATKIDAIIALGNLGDPAAIPFLEPFVSDNSESHLTDDRGWPLRVGDLAADSLRQLRRAADPAPRPPPLPVRTRHFSIFPFIPLMAAGIQLPWIAALVVIVLFRNGSIPSERIAVHQLDFIAMLPALIGLGFGVGALISGQVRTPAQCVCFIIGIAVCGLATFGFSWELFD